MVWEDPLPRRGQKSSKRNRIYFGKKQVTVGAADESAWPSTYGLPVKVGAPCSWTCPMGLSIRWCRSETKGGPDCDICRRLLSKSKASGGLQMFVSDLFSWGHQMVFSDLAAEGSRVLSDCVAVVKIVGASEGGLVFSDCVALKTVGASEGSRAIRCLAKAAGRRVEVPEASSRHGRVWLIAKKSEWMTNQINPKTVLRNVWQQLSTVKYEKSVCSCWCHWKNKHGKGCGTLKSCSCMVGNFKGHVWKSNSSGASKDLTWTAGELATWKRQSASAETSAMLSWIFCSWFPGAGSLDWQREGLQALNALLLVNANMSQTHLWDAVSTAVGSVMPQQCDPECWLPTLHRCRVTTT